MIASYLNPWPNASEGAKTISYQLRISLALSLCGKAGSINRQHLAGVYVAALSIAIVIFLSSYYIRKNCLMFSGTPFLLLAGTTIPALLFLVAAYRFHPLAKELVFTLEQALLIAPS